MSASLDVCEQRDPKGPLQEGARRPDQELHRDRRPYEAPPNAETVVHTDAETLDESVDKILGRLIDLGYLAPP